MMPSEEFIRADFWSEDQMPYETNWIHPNYTKLIKLK